MTPKDRQTNGSYWTDVASERVLVVIETDPTYFWDSDMHRTLHTLDDGQSDTLSHVTRIVRVVVISCECMGGCGVCCRCGSRYESIDSHGQPETDSAGAPRGRATQGGGRRPRSRGTVANRGRHSGRIPGQQSSATAGQPRIGAQRNPTVAGSAPLRLQRDACCGGGEEGSGGEGREGRAGGEVKPSALRRHPGHVCRRSCSPAASLPHRCVGRTATDRRRRCSSSDSFPSPGAAEHSDPATAPAHPNDATAATAPERLTPTGCRRKQEIIPVHEFPPRHSRALLCPE